MKQREIDFCNRCPSNYTCGYLNRNLQNDCPRLNDYQDGYEEGEEDAISKACEWLKENLHNYWSQGITDPFKFIEEFREAMEESV